MTKTFCRLKKLRKAAHLSQRELARLVGLKSQGVISEIEAGLRRPGLIVALSSAVVFDRPVAEVFPALARHSLKVTLVGAAELESEGGIAAEFAKTLVVRLGDPDLDHDADA